MFEAAEVGATVAKEDYESAVPGLRVDLVNAQFDLRQAPFPVLLVVIGDDRAGCSDVVNLLNEWMDARYIGTEAFLQPHPEEAEHPRFWRYWGALPPRGRIGLAVGGWVYWPLVERVQGRIDDAEFDSRVQRIARFEQMLADDGAVILKLWIHLPREEARKRLKRAKKDPEKEWRVDAVDEALYESLEELLPAADRLIRRTSTAAAPWEVVEGSDPRHRNLAVARAVLAAIQRGLAAGAAPPASPAPAPTPTPEAPLPRPSVLDRVDLSARLEYADYRERLESLQRALRKRVARARESRVASVLVFEGWDAAGKGGAIRRITRALDAWNYRVVPVTAPSDEEAAHHYLWRFWRQLPRAGHLLIFDRSWYGRVLVERVEGLAREDEWRRAYAEINTFEEQLVAHGMPVLKFFLHLDREEQMRRFAAREQTAYKKYKITSEDYRNRGRWDDYVAAVDEMVARTSTAPAPWHLVSANDKRWARMEVLRIVCEGLRAAVKGD